MHQSRGPRAPNKAKAPAAVGKHALRSRKQQALCGLGSGCEHETDQNVGSAQV